MDTHAHAAQLHPRRCPADVQAAVAGPKFLLSCNTLHHFSWRLHQGPTAGGIWRYLSQHQPEPRDQAANVRAADGNVPAAGLGGGNTGGLSRNEGLQVMN